MRLLSTCAAGLVVAAVAGPSAPARSPDDPKYVVERFAPDVISTRDYERDGTFSPDGAAFYFTKRTIWPYFSAICVSRLRDGHWMEPEVAPFSGQYADATPTISPDGARLYFASGRPVNGVASPGYNIWVADRTEAGWSAPRILPSPINGRGSVLAPIETRDGSLYFVAGDVPHVVVARRHGDTWDPPVPAGAPNAEGSYELSAYVDPDERFMIVAVVGRPDALNTAEGIYQRSDLYVRERVGVEWSALRHLDAPINSGADEGSPFVSPDGQYLYFTSERGAFTEHGPSYSIDGLERALHSPGNGLGDIYRVDFRATGIATPRLFGDGVISTSDDEFGGSFTPNGDTVYFTKSSPHSYRYTMLESHRAHGRWTTPTVLPFSGRYADSDPTLSPDGTKMFWTSDRPVNGQIKHDYDLWMVERTPSGTWGAPQRLPEPINSDASEYAASMTRDGTLYFSSARDGPIQAYRSARVNGTWSTPENITRLINHGDSTVVFDLDVMIDPDERFIMLGSLGRKDGFGNYDIYVSWRDDGVWTTAVHLPAPFNTRARDYAPHLSPDKKTLYFSSERGFALDPIGRPLSYRELTDRLRGTRNGSGNIYEISMSMMESFHPPR
ncbi:MAG: hypothetical protein ABJF01_16410 [bacterium]